MTKRTAIILLTIITAVIHLGLGIADLASGDSTSLAIPFVLNGLGYIALLAGLYFIPQLQAQRSLIRYALMGFAAVTIVLYFVFQGADGFTSIPGLVTKAVEVVLVVLLATES